MLLLPPSSFLSSSSSSLSLLTTAFSSFSSSHHLLLNHFSIPAVTAGASASKPPPPLHKLFTSFIHHTCIYEHTQFSKDSLVLTRCYRSIIIIPISCLKEMPLKLAIVRLLQQLIRKTINSSLGEVLTTALHKNPDTTLAGPI